MKDIFLLDLDETLVDFSRAEERNFYESLAFAGVKADGRMYGRFHEINDALWKSLERGEIGREALKVRRFEKLFRAYGIEADAEKVSAFYYRNFQNFCFPFRGSENFLKKLSTRGRVYIVTNGGTEIQHAHVKIAGFERFLSGMFISEEIGFDKPMSEFATHVEEHIPDYERARAVWIGDSLTSDMVCAKSVGIDFILYLPHTMSVPYGGLVARNYSEILSLLDKM